MKVLRWCGDEQAEGCNSDGVRSSGDRETAAAVGELQASLEASICRMRERRHGTTAAAAFGTRREQEGSRGLLQRLRPLIVGRMESAVSGGQRARCRWTAASSGGGAASGRRGWVRTTGEAARGGAGAAVRAAETERKSSEEEEQWALLLFSLQPHVPSPKLPALATRRDLIESRPLRRPHTHSLLSNLVPGLDLSPGGRLSFNKKEKKEKKKGTLFLSASLPYFLRSASSVPRYLRNPPHISLSLFNHILSLLRRSAATLLAEPAGPLLRRPMAKLCLHALLALLLLRLALSADPPQIPPSPSPELADGAPPPASGAPLSSPPSVGSPAASDTSSPPSPPPSGSPPAPTPAPTAAPKATTPAPSPVNSTGSLHSAVSDEDVGGGAGGSSGGGLSSTKKAGIVAGAIVFAGVVLLGAMVYKKRKDNIRRAQYSSAARREIL